MGPDSPTGRSRTNRDRLVLAFLAGAFVVDRIRFLAAAEILETDLWQQYNELGGIQDSEVPGGSGSAAYTAALGVLDADMDQYIHDNTEDEFTHTNFINAYLTARGAAREP